MFCIDILKCCLHLLKSITSSRNIETANCLRDIIQYIKTVPYLYSYIQKKGKHKEKRSGKSYLRQKKCK